MYSGTDGREFEADIFFGVVYYQRLRHMVADKYQVACVEFFTLPSLNVSYQWVMTSCYACHLIGSESRVT